MKKILVITTLLFFYFKVLFAASITDELTKLNNLYKEGAITKEEFSKAKSILLKTGTSKEKDQTKKDVNQNKKIKSEQKTKTKEEQIVVKKKEINEDLTKSYMHIDEIRELGSFEPITDAPDGMFKTKGKSFSQRAKNASSYMYLIFVQQKNLMEKNPENLMKAMGHFEFFYMEQLRKKKKSISKFKEKWPNIPSYVKKDIKSLYSLNQARKSMRESMGLTLEDEVVDALDRYMLMHNFLSLAKKETIKLNSQQKKIRKNSKKLNTGISSLKKNIELRKDQRITEKEFNKSLEKNIKISKQALNQLTKDEINGKFYNTVKKAFEDTFENNNDLELSLDSLNFINAIVKDVEKEIIPKKYIQNMKDISVDEMSEADQKTLASVSISMKIHKKEKKDLFHNSMLNLSNKGVNVNQYIDEIQKNDFNLKSVTMTFDDFDNMKNWASKDWAKSWKGELPSEVKDIDGNIIEFTDENIEDLKAQLAINTFNEMIKIDQTELQGSINDNIKEIAQEIQSSGGFNIDDYLNQDFTITLNNYSKLVGDSVGIEINDFKDLTRYANELYGSDIKVEDYASQWQTAQYMDSTSNWGDVTIGVDLIDQVGSFDAASIAKSIGTDLQTVADSISQAATVGVSTDLEAAAKGLGYSSFADAVDAYNKQYGTNYTVDSAKEALGQ